MSPDVRIGPDPWQSPVDKNPPSELTGRLRLEDNYEATRVIKATQKAIAVCIASSIIINPSIVCALPLIIGYGIHKLTKVKNQEQRERLKDEW